MSGKDTGQEGGVRSMFGRNKANKTKKHPTADLTTGMLHSQL